MPSRNARRGAIVGFGSIAERAHIAALSQCAVELVGIVEIAPERAATARRLYPHLAVYSTLEALLAQQSVDFIDICTPPHLHFQTIAQAMRAGVHVLCEKPLVLTQAHGQALAALAAVSDVVVACVHNWTYAPILMETRAWTESGVIGDLMTLNFSTLRTQPATGEAADNNWRTDPKRSGGGILFDHGWHGMSILLRQIQAAPVEVLGKISSSAHLGLTVEDTSDTAVRFDNGVTGNFHATWAGTERRNEATLTGDKGVLKVCNDTLEAWQGPQRIAQQTFADSLALGGYRPAWVAGVMSEFIDEVEGRKARGRMLQEALSSLALVLATYASAAAGGGAIAV